MTKPKNPFEEFQKKLSEEQENLQPEFAKAIDKCLWGEPDLNGPRLHIFGAYIHIDKSDDDIITITNAPVEFRSELQYGGTVEANLDGEKIYKIVHRLLKYFQDHEGYSSETIHQSDDCLIDAPVVLGDIADLINFKVEY